jgi:HSP20 family protein
MANIAIHKNGGQAPLANPTAARREREWEPMRMMREMMGFDPFREMAPFWPADERGAFLPAFEVKETKDGYLFKADLPGVKEGDLDITLTGNRLSVTGKRESEQQEKTDTYYVYERSYGTFSRAFTLPEGVEAAKVHAELKEGVLTIDLPKRPELQAKRIAVGGPTTETAKKG